MKKCSLPINDMSLTCTTCKHQMYICNGVSRESAGCNRKRSMTDHG